MNGAAKTADGHRGYFYQGGYMKEHGFTLLELLITVSVIAILFALAVPGFSNQLQSARTRTVTLDLLQSASHARTLAVTQGRRTTLRQREQWELGWDVFIDENNNGVLDEDEVLVHRREAVPGVRISANQPVRQYISYISTGESRYVGSAQGGAFQAGTFSICPTDSGAGYRLVLARSGRLRMETQTELECAGNEG
jgi:type IV fimbrial biogenesis protein FimT